jgi:cholera toxin transcriptional activator
MTPTTTARIFRFGTFELNEATGELRKEGNRIKLHAQPFQVLVMMLERPTELVTREEMQQRLWGDDTIVDFDHGLNTAVNKLREALGDAAARPRHVETVPGRGYRFIAPVTLVEPASRLLSGERVVVADAVTSCADDEIDAAGGSDDDAPGNVPRTLLTSPHDLPDAPRALVRTLLLLIQAMYLAFYMGALANIPEIREIFADSGILSPAILTSVLVVTAVALIPVRLFLFTAVVFDFQQLQEKFKRIFPVLLWMDLLWALSPFLLIHHIPGGLALGMTAALVYMPFAQRSLVLMYVRDLH